MRIPHGLEQVVVFSFKDRPSAESGNDETGATGFWISAEVAGLTMAFLVTNRHVIESGSTTFRVNGRHPELIATIETSEEDWYFPDDPNIDLALFVAGPNDRRLAAQHIPLQNFILPETSEKLDMRLGDDVAMLGRHRGYDGIKRNEPSARFGNIAQFPGELIPDERGRASSCFLVQIPSMPGYSGSPVFLMQDLAEKHAESGGIMMGGNSARAIGLLGSGLIDRARR